MQSHTIRTLELNGLTVAVMAGGIDRLYPAKNLELFQRYFKVWVDYL